MATWSISQNKWIETPVQGGASIEIPGGMAPSTGGGLDIKSLYSKLFALDPGAALKQGSKFKTALDILQPAPTAAEGKEEATRKAAVAFNSQMDRLLKDWNKMSLLERLPIPGAARISPRRAKYETTRDLFDYMLITMVADKRITDQERKYFVKQFPSLLSTKEVAKTKIDAIKNFVTVFNEMPAPATIETSQGTISIDDLWQ